MPDQLDEMTMREFNNALIGISNRDVQHSQDAWERSRMLAVTLMQPHLKKNSKLTPYKLWNFDWDPKPKPEKFDKERLDYVLKRNNKRTKDARRK